MIKPFVNEHSFMSHFNGIYCIFPTKPLTALAYTLHENPWTESSGKLKAKASLEDINNST